jgi:hypothetical protein
VNRPRRKVPSPLKAEMILSAEKIIFAALLLVAFSTLFTKYFQVDRGVW